MRSATAGVCGSSRRIPRPRLPPACSFFSGKKKGRASGARDVVLQGPEILIPSSRGTTSLSSSGPSAPWTWCSMTRKSLFLRRGAPRPSARPALWCPRRGASWPANPYSFVGRYHAPEPIRACGASDVVLHGPQILIPSSRGTTSLGSAGPPAPGTWCSKARKSIFLRREAPRPLALPALRRPGRGASWPGNPYSFVERHHVPRLGWPSSAVDVVLHGPQILIPSSGGTTSLCPSESPAHRPCDPSYLIYLYIFLCENVESICRYHL